MPTFFECQVLTVESGDLQPDIREGLQSKRLLYHYGVSALTGNGMALDEEAVALMLEVAIHLALAQ